MKLIVNNTVSLAKINDNETMIYQDNNFKSIECDFEILNNVLNSVNIYGNKEEIYNKYKENFSKEEIDQFLNVLISENIVLISEDINQDRKPSILLVSDEEMCNNILESFLDEVDIEKIVNDIVDVEKEINLFNFDCVFIAKSNMKYKDCILLNDLLVKSKLPFIILRYDGKNIISGPFVFPMKGACYECILEHHIDRLNENENVNLIIDNFDDLYMAKPIDYNMYRKAFLFCLDKIKNDIVKLRIEKANFYFFQKEEILNVETNELKICEYYPTTSCSCCNGIIYNLI